MKKTLVLLPLAALFLAGCGGNNSQPSGGTTYVPPTAPPTTAQPTSRSEEPTTINPGPSHIEGFDKVEEAPVDEAIYKYGNYQSNAGKLIFMNGDIHKDEKGEYPWYATSTQDPTLGVDIRCEYVDETNFTLKVIGGGESDRFYGKYLSVHYTINETSGANTISFSFVDDPVNWQYSETLKAPVRDVSKEVPVDFDVKEATLGTYDMYETFSGTADFRYETNFIAHLWKAAEPVVE